MEWYVPVQLPVRFCPASFIYEQGIHFNCDFSLTQPALSMKKESISNPLCMSFGVRSWLRMNASCMGNLVQETVFRVSGSTGLLQGTLCMQGNSWMGQTLSANESWRALSCSMLSNYRTMKLLNIHRITFGKSERIIIGLDIECFGAYIWLGAKGRDPRLARPSEGASFISP